MPNPLTVYPEPDAADWIRLTGPMRAWLSECTGLFQWGRSAIYWALRGLNLKPGSTIYLPAYHCGVEIDAALAAGFKPDYYRVGADLSIDLEDLEQKLRRAPAPVLAIHYFGFVQPHIEQLANLCRTHGSPLIEDCAHALHARIDSRLAGEFAPISIYSLYKSLPTLEGGALRVDSARLHEQTGIDFTPPTTASHSAATWKLFAKTAARHILGNRVTSMYRNARFGPDAPQPEGDPVYEPEPCDYTRGMGWPARFIAGGYAPDLIANRRRKNYELLASQITGLPGYEFLPGPLTEGACPLVLPIRSPKRDALRSRLAANGIETYLFGLWRHPSFDPSPFPEIQALRREVIGLPIHQNLSPERIGRIALLVQNASRS